MEQDDNAIEDSSSEARRERTYARIYKMMQVLSDTPQGLSTSDAWEAGYDAAPLVDDDLEMLSTGEKRGENKFLWQFLALRKAGWIIRYESFIKITIAGKAAVEKYPTADEFGQRQDHAYQEWKALRNPSNYVRDLDPSTEVLPSKLSDTVVTEAIGRVIRTGLSTGMATFDSDIPAWSE